LFFFLLTTRMHFDLLCSCQCRDPRLRCLDTCGVISLTWLPFLFTDLLSIEFKLMELPFTPEHWVQVPAVHTGVQVHKVRSEICFVFCLFGFNDPLDLLFTSELWVQVPAVHTGVQVHKIRSKHGTFVNCLFFCLFGCTDALGSSLLLPTLRHTFCSHHKLINTWLKIWTTL
jgi:hypothetical protein